MENKHLSTSVSTYAPKSLSGWDRAIFEAKARISELKRSIRTFQELRDRGMEWPEPSKDSEGKITKTVTLKKTAK